MSTEENKALVRRFWEEVNKRNVGVVDELLDASFVFHRPAGQEVRGPEGVKQELSMLLTAFPDLHWTIEDMVAEGDKVAARTTITGTHQGEFMGIAATGKRVTWTEIYIPRIVGGKYVEAWEEFDQLGLMQQIGAIPSG